MLRVSLNGDAFSPTRNRVVAIQAMLVPPNTDGGPRFEMEILQNVLHVILDGAGTAPEDLSDLAVAFTSGDPFDDFELVFGEETRAVGISGSGLVYFG